MKILEILPILQNDQKVRVIFEKNIGQIVYQGTAGELSKQTITDCDITHITPESVDNLWTPQALIILNIYIKADKFAKREYPEY